MEKLKKKVTVGLVGGSDLVKILEQVGGEQALPKFDYLFSENGLVTHKSGQLIFQEVSRLVGQIWCVYVLNFPYFSRIL